MEGDGSVGVGGRGMLGVGTSLAPLGGCVGLLPGERVAAGVLGGGGVGQRLQLAAQ